jgi:hypothetical protein
MTTTPTPSDSDQRAEYREQLSAELEEMASELMQTIARLCDLAEAAYVAGDDGVSRTRIGRGTPKPGDMVAIWNLFVRMRHEVDLGQRQWRELDTKAAFWAAAHYKAYVQAGPQITGDNRL